jgi:hypothetical protein
MTPGVPSSSACQEVNPRIAKELRARLPKICSGRYDLVTDADPGNDREVVLSTLPVVGSRRFHLAGPLRTALWVTRDKSRRNRRLLHDPPREQ